MKRCIAVFLSVMLLAVCLCGCGSSSSDYERDYDAVYDAEPVNGYGSGDSYNSFSNDYGTKTTKCAHAGCNSYIATSGDTNCCVVHSNNCLECYCYIDEDAMYCMDCLTDALDGDGGSGGGSNSGYFSNDYGTKTTKCAHAGCNSYIASSGDTNCCVVHSNNCLECYCYIDEDAMYCMDCLSDAVYGNDSYDSYNDYGDSYNSYGNECYICGGSAYSKYGSYYYCSDCLDLVKAFS